MSVNEIEFAEAQALGQITECEGSDDLAALAGDQVFLSGVQVVWEHLDGNNADAAAAWSNIWMAYGSMFAEQLLD